MGGRGVPQVDRPVRRIRVAHRPATGLSRQTDEDQDRESKEYSHFEPNTGTVPLASSLLPTAGTKLFPVVRGRTRKEPFPPWLTHGFKTTDSRP